MGDKAARVIASSVRIRLRAEVVLRDGTDITLSQLAAMADGMLRAAESFVGDAEAWELTDARIEAGVVVLESETTMPLNGGL